MNVEAALRNLDRPIQSFEEDLLQRRGFVQTLCRIFAAASPHESTVFALYGEWGSGKTSVKNLLKNELTSKGEKSPIPIEFNPWAFSGQDQVLEAFFSEIGKALSRDEDGKAAAERFKKLGAYLSFGAKTAKTIHVGLDLFGIPGSKLVGMVGEKLEGGSKDAKEYGEQIDTLGQTSLEQIQADLKDALAKFPRPLLIIIDDLDRLTPDQLLTMFQIVKLNANLPRVNYLLLMDAKTIAERLKHKQLGPEFIEKIVQFELALPHVPPEELKAILKAGFEAVMGKYAAQIDWERWEDAWTNGCQSIFTTLRRIKRFLHTLKFHVAVFASDDVLEVDPVDLFLVETLRKCAPELHAQMPRLLRPIIVPEPALLIPSLFGEDSKEQFGKKELNRLIQLADEGLRPHVERLLETLFPQLGQAYQSGDREQLWLRDARICHSLFFESYFRLAIPYNLPTQQEIRQVFESATDRRRLRERLNNLYEKVGLHSLIIRIHSHHKSLKPETLSAFLSELWRLDEIDARAAGIERDGPHRESTQSLGRFLIQKLCPPESRVECVNEAYRDSDNLHALVRLVDQEVRAKKQDPHSRLWLFTDEERKALQQTCITELRTAAERGTILASPDSGILLYVWVDMDSPEAVRGWASKQAQEPVRLARLLSRMISRTTSSTTRETKVHYYITRKALEKFFLLDEDFAQRLTKIDRNELPHWERFAVEQTLKRIEQKRQGIEEAEYHEWE